MNERLDLLKIAREEQSGNLFKLLDSVYKRSKIQPRGISDAVIWEGGSTRGNVKPVAHALTDKLSPLACPDASPPVESCHRRHG